MNKIVKSLILALICLFALALLSCCVKQKPSSAQIENEQTKNIYLTFDDGPTNSTTPKILDVLKDYGVKATFFVVGRQIPSRTEILKRMESEGHAIGIHTQTHVYKDVYASADALKKDILTCKDAINKVLPDYKITLYRFPGGSFNLSDNLKSVPEQCGLRYFDWNADTDDSIDKTASPEKLYTTAIKTGHDRNKIILLMHDGVNYDNTVSSLPDIIEYYKQKGYEFKTLLEYTL